MNVVQQGAGQPPYTNIVQSRIKPESPTPHFTLDKPKSVKPSKGFKQEVKNLLKTDKPSITIEKKSEA